LDGSGPGSVDGVRVGAGKDDFGKGDAGGGVVIEGGAGAGDAGDTSAWQAGNTSSMTHKRTSQPALNIIFICHYFNTNYRMAKVREIVLSSLFDKL